MNSEQIVVSKGCLASRFSTKNAKDIINETALLLSFLHTITLAQLSPSQQLGPYASSFLTLKSQVTLFSEGKQCTCIYFFI